MKGLVIYHANCNDGWVAAMVAKRALGEAYEYKPIQYGQEGTFDWETYDSIFMVDFSIWPPPPNVTIMLDHHATALAKAATLGLGVPQEGFLSGHGFVLDMARSGARMAWDYWFPTISLPWIVAYAEDHDLWRFVLPYSREVRAGMSLLPRTLDWVDYDLAEVTSWGHTILEYEGLYVDRLTDNALDLMIVGKADYHLKMLNTGYCISDVGHRLLEKNPGIHAAAMWFQLDHQTVVVSLRGPCAREIAELFGGGGHDSAAGFKLTTDTGIKQLFNGKLLVT